MSRSACGSADEMAIMSSYAHELGALLTDVIYRFLKRLGMDSGDLETFIV